MDAFIPDRTLALAAVAGSGTKKGRLNDAQCISAVVASGTQNFHWQNRGDHVKRLRLVPVSAVVACLVIGALIGGGSYVFARGGGSQVVCHVTGKHVVSCPKKELHGKRGIRGPQGLPGPAGPPGAAGVSGAGSNLNLNFNAYLTPNKTREIEVGNFVITAASDALGHCVPISLRAGSSDSRLSVGAGTAFGFLVNNTSEFLTDGTNSNMFTAVTENGASTMSGIVGSVTAGGRCLVSGYVTGV